MPQLGETVTEGTITRWLKKLGDPVAEDEVLFEVSTDKVDSEVPSPAAGVLSEILVQEGDTVDVGTRLAVISPAGAGTASNGAAPAALTPEPAAPTLEPTAPTLEPAAPAPEPAMVPADPPAAAEEAAVAVLPGPATGGAVPAGGGTDGGKVLSPVVRRLIAEHNLDPGGISGSGAGGRITRGDVLALIDKRSNGGAPPAQPPSPSRPQAPAPAAQPAAAAAQPAPAPGRDVEPFGPAAPGERDTVIPFTNIRRRTAEHMVRSKHTSAHTVVAVEVDYLGVERARAAQKAAFKETEGFSLTYLPFVARATIDAIEQFPNLNSSVGDDALIVHGEVHLGIAVDLDFEGLLVPVIHQADGKRLRQLAREISSLAAKARGRRLTMDDIAGGTFTITNAGPFGTLLTVPVINQPQTAILSTDGVRKRPVAVEMPDGSDGIAVHPVGNLVLSFDHRAFDGAYAAAFVARIKEIIETRDWSSEL
jgi:2-oxoglutarate dehydrogenase E2 component (dihydrolipoamide succinyltransferase)